MSGSVSVKSFSKLQNKSTAKILKKLEKATGVPRISPHDDAPNTIHLKRTVLPNVKFENNEKGRIQRSKSNTKIHIRSPTSDDMEVAFEGKETRSTYYVTKETFPTGENNEATGQDPVQGAESVQLTENTLTTETMQGLPSSQLLNSSVLRDKEKREKAGAIRTLRHSSTKDVFGKEKLIITSPEKQKSPIPNKTLVRFVDKMILDGALPMDAIKFFHPESSGITSSVGMPTLKKVKTLPHLSKRIEDKKMRDLTRDVSECVPNWLKENTAYIGSYRVRPIISRTPVYDILIKIPSERESSELQFVAKWLEKLDIFSKFPWDILVKLAKKLKALRLSEGDVLCRAGDYADCLYIVYQGELDILVNQEKKGVIATGQTAGRGALDKGTERTATLRANQETYMILLFRNDYQEVTGNLAELSYSKQMIHEFIMEHPFFRYFSEVKNLQLVSAIKCSKFYKNEVVYTIGKPADMFYILLNGSVVMEMPVPKEKVNRWPISLKEWKETKLTIIYSVTLNIQPGEIFGVREMIFNGTREEKAIVMEDSFILSLTRDQFIQSSSF